jgi:uncharacterized protein YndB with AHSA1/START domain
MKVLKVLLVTLVALAGLLAAFGLLLPDRLDVERRTEVAAEQGLVYELVAGFDRFNEWSPWAGLDPATRYAVSGPPQGVGARMEWHSDTPRVASGSQEIVAANPPREVRIRLVFDGQGEAFSTLRLVPTGAGTRVSWRFSMELGMNPVTRWIGFLVADRSVGADYERGLARLKELAEAEAAVAAAEPEAVPVPDDAAEPASDFGPISL